MIYKTVIFDLDGTLLNTLDDLVDSINYVLKQMSFPTRSTAEIRSFVGNGVGALVKAVLPEDISEEQTLKFTETFKMRYKEHLQDKTRPYDGILELLEELKAQGARMAVVSNKYDSAVKMLCKEYFDEWIAEAVGESKTVRRKPSPDGVLSAMKALGGQQDTTIYVGDSEVDVQTAQNAGIRCVAVTWGFRDKEVLVQAKADFIIDRPQELLEIV